MTDAGLVRWIAENILGWYLQDEMVMVSTGEEVKGYFTKDGLVCYEKDFDPIANLNLAFMIVEKMREDGIYIMLEPTPDSYSAVPLYYGDGTVSARGGAKHKKPGHAILLAAKKAIEGGTNAS